MKLMYINSIFANFKWYRRKQGGTWYKVIDTASASGFAGAIRYWTREAPVGDLVLLVEENYSDKGVTKIAT
jgi:hypothetical protein